MKKFLLALSIIGIIASTNIVMAESFDSLQNLTPAQKQELSQIQFNYKNQIDALDNKIMNYKNNLTRVQKDITKSKEEIALVSSSYQRNIQTLETQKSQLEDAMRNAYRSVMTTEQFRQYSSQQLKVQDAFSEFVRTAK